MRLWRRRKPSEVQLAIASSKLMNGQYRVIALDTPPDDLDEELAVQARYDEDLEIRMLRMTMHYGMVTLVFGSDGLWQASTSSSHKVYSGQTKHQALDALEGDLKALG